MAYCICIDGKLPFEGMYAIGKTKRTSSYKRTRPLCCFLLFAVRKEGRLQSQNFLEQEGMEQLVSLQGLQAVK